MLKLEPRYNGTTILAGSNLTIKWFIGGYFGGLEDEHEGVLEASEVLPRSRPAKIAGATGHLRSSNAIPGAFPRVVLRRVHAKNGQEGILGCEVRWKRRNSS